MSSQESEAPSEVINPQTQNLLDRLTECINNTRSSIYSASREDSRREAEEILFFLKQKATSAQHRTEVLMEDSDIVEKYQDELAKRIKDEQKMMKIVYKAEQAMETIRFQTKLQQLTEKSKRIQEKRNKEDLQKDLRDLNALIEEVIQSEGVRYEDKKIMISNAKLAMREILTHSETKDQQGIKEDLAAGIPNMLEENIAAGYNSLWSTVINAGSAAISGIGRGIASASMTMGSNLMAAAEVGAYAGLGAIRTGVITARNAGSYFSELVSLGAAGCQLSIETLSEVIRINKMIGKDEEANDLLDALRNYNDQISDLVLASVSTTPVSSPGVSRAPSISGRSERAESPPFTPEEISPSENLITLEEAFSQGSNNSSIASSKLSSRPISRTSSIQAPFSRTSSFNPGFASASSSSLELRPEDEELLSRSSRTYVSKRSQITNSSQSVNESLQSLKDTRERILSIQEGLRALAQQQAINFPNVEQETEKVMANFSPIEDGNLVIDNLDEIESNFNSVSTSNVQTMGLNMQTLQERLEPLAAQQTNTPQDETEIEGIEGKKEKLLISLKLLVVE